MSVEGKNQMTFLNLWLQWRGMNKVKYIPFLANYIILPLSIFIYKRVIPESYEEFVESQMFMFIPLFSVWWEMILMRSYVEGGEKELLWMYKKNIVLDIMVYFVVYLVFQFPIFWYVLNYTERGIVYLPLLLSQCFLYAGAFYGGSMAFCSITPSFVAVLAYTLYAQGRVAELLSVVKGEGVQTLVYYLIAGIVFFIFGATFRNYKES